MRLSRVVVYGTGLLLISASLWGCGRGGAPSSGLAKPKPVLVQVAEVQPQTLQSTLELVGTIEPKLVATITAPSDGAIEELYVRENQRVEKNEVVGMLGSAARQALLGETRARLQSARSRALEPDSPGHGAPRADDLRRATEDYEYARRLFLGVPIVSPIAGRVIDKPIEAGSIVSARQPLLTVADLNTLIIRSAVPELLLRRLTLGQKLRVRVDAYPDREFSGAISLISPQVDPATRTCAIEVRVADATGRLKPGMFAAVEVVTERRENALAVPADAIIVRADGQRLVFVVQDSVAHPRTVTTGLAARTRTEISTGLHAGDRVVVMGQDFLKDGSPVKVQRAADGAARPAGPAKEPRQ